MGEIDPKVDRFRPERYSPGHLHREDICTVTEQTFWLTRTIKGVVRALSYIEKAPRKSNSPNEWNAYGTNLTH